MGSFNRRSFLKRAALWLGGSIGGAFTGLASYSLGRITSDPFRLGIASGSPLPNSVILWTRLAPDPIKGGGLDPLPIEVKWEVADDEHFHKIVKTGTTLASPDFAHSVHVNVTDLKPARWYFYRFMAGDAVSPVGRTRTAPAPGADNAKLCFAVASCQQYEQGFYAAHRHMADEPLDVVLFVGDYIYDSSWGKDLVRHHDSPEPRTLEAYRNRYALYKTDPDLQLCHQKFPFIFTWDDHEVSNDYANDRSEDLDKNFLARRAASYQAFYEHTPMREICIPGDPNLRIYRAYDFGQLARLHVLDDRQYRDHQIGAAAGRGGSGMVKKSPALESETRTILGKEQEAWLADSLKNSSANWDIIVQQTLMAQALHPTGTFWTDGWDGYPAARRRLLESTMRGPGHDTIVVGGDVHASAVCDLKTNFDDPKSPVVATEFCGTSITSQQPFINKPEIWTANNPHFRFANVDKRGYLMITLGQKDSHAAIRAVADVKDPKSEISTLARFAVEKGRPGAQMES